MGKSRRTRVSSLPVALRIARWLWAQRNPILFVSVVVWTIPGLVPLVRRAVGLAGLSVEERRQAVMGDFYSTLRRVPRDGPRAILLLGPNALDRGVFVNYYLYPTPSRLYHGRLPADAPSAIVAVAHEGPVRQTVVDHPRPVARVEGEAFVPFAASLLGADSYATEAIVAADGRSHVTITLLPSGAAKAFTLAPGERRVFSDVVQEVAGRRETGWLRIRASGPVRAGFWLVARADAIATPLPVLSRLPTSSRELTGGERLWVLNPGARSATVRINGREQTLPPFALRMLPAEPVNAVEGAFAFTSRKMTFDWGAS